MEYAYLTKLNLHRLSQRNKGDKDPLGDTLLNYHLFNDCRGISHKQRVTLKKIDVETAIRNAECCKWCHKREYPEAYNKPLIEEPAHIPNKDTFPRQVVVWQCSNEMVFGDEIDALRYEIELLNRRSNL